jgi:hypothetical protein
LAADREAVLDRERRRALPAGLAALAAVAFVIASIAVAGQVNGGSGEAEFLKNVDAHQTARMVAAVLQAIGVGLLALPLYHLFRAAAARSDRVRPQLVGVVVAGPLFLAVASVLTGISALHAADDFVANELPRLLSKGVKIGSDRANEVASETSNDASLRPLAAGFAIAGQIGLLIGMAYTALHAMRTGLLSRFWGSLGVALGVISFIFFLFTVLWFAYLGLLILGRLPGGRPPAWDAGTAVPWPSPGERMSAQLGAGEGARAEGEKGEAEPAAGAGEGEPPGQAGEAEPAEAEPAEAQPDEPRSEEPRPRS